MPRFNVEYNGKWACFSTVTDEFLTEFMDKSNYEEWRKNEIRFVHYGKENFKPAEQCNVYTMDEAVSSASLNHSRKDVIQDLVWSGLTVTEAEQLYDKYKISPEEIAEAKDINEPREEEPCSVIKKLDGLMKKLDSLYAPIKVKGKIYPANNPYVMNEINTLLRAGRIRNRYGEQSEIKDEYLEIKDLEWNDERIEVRKGSEEYPAEYLFFKDLEEVSMTICDEINKLKDIEYKIKNNIG